VARLVLGGDRLGPIAEAKGQGGYALFEGAGALEKEIRDGGAWSVDDGAFTEGGALGLAAVGGLYASQAVLLGLQCVDGEDSRDLLVLGDGVHEFPKAFVVDVDDVALKERSDIAGAGLVGLACYVDHRGALCGRCALRFSRSRCTALGVPIVIEADDEALYGGPALGRD